MTDKTPAPDGTADILGRHLADLRDQIARLTETTAALTRDVDQRLSRLDDAAAALALISANLTRGVQTVADYHRAQRVVADVVGLLAPAGNGRPAQDGAHA